MKITIHKRDWALFESEGSLANNTKNTEMSKVGFSRKIGRFVYKTIRMMYGSFIFYFLPYSSLFIPYIASALMSSSDPTVVA